MRTTMIFDDALVDRARELTGLTEKMAVVHAAALAAMLDEGVVQCHACLVDARSRASRCGTACRVRR